MCASFISLLLILVLCSMRMVTEGLPLSRQERGIHQDLIAGADFLSVLMDSPAVRQAYRELTMAAPTTTTHPTLQIPSNSLREYIEENTPVVRESRNTRSTTVVEQHTFTQVPSGFGAKSSPNTSDRTTIKVQSDKVSPSKHSSESSKTNASLIISVQISSSEGDSHINKISHEAKASTDLHAFVETTSETTTEGEQTVISSEEHPSLIAEVNKSEFSVDEGEPITSNSDSLDAYTHEYPANVQPLPSLQSSTVKEKVPSFEHHSVIYHDNPREPIRGRSVSYSTVIQTLPKQPDGKPWSDPNHNHKERQERHYEVKDGANENQFDKAEDKHKSENYGSTSNKSTIENSQYQPSSSVAESNDYFITSKYESSSDYRGDIYSERKETSWEKPEQAYSSESSSKKNLEPTEKNWEVPEKQHAQQEKPYVPPSSTQKHHVPLVYGKPEQNYEVDETVSVMSNGRAHGVQPLHKLQISTPTVEVKTDLTNDNQKVGYVVEGRNYRKYRVEERTSDGFIVGEYGVVSHDDGSLRGVRYTADGTINPRLIYDALMKFLSL